MTITPKQLTEWRKEYADYGWMAYLRLKTEQATEIAELKAKLAHLKKVCTHDRIEWEDFPPTSQLAFADLMKD